MSDAQAQAGGQSEKPAQQPASTQQSQPERKPKRDLKAPEYLTCLASKRFGDIDESQDGDGQRSAPTDTEPAEDSK
ncbi:MAG: hypothetical protein ACK4UN_02295 [Limisphaerales bacterium]